jgi:hypothetical protein
MQDALPYAKKSCKEPRTLIAISNASLYNCLYTRQFNCLLRSVRTELTNLNSKVSCLYRRRRPAGAMKTLILQTETFA